MPSLDTFNRLAGALVIEGQALEELRRLWELGHSPSRQLNAYLVAAEQAAREHPYPGVLPGTMPPLAAVYVCQQVRTTGGFKPGPGGTVRGVRPAEEVLARGETGVVIAGPGGGKSTLLRSYLAASAASWQTGQASAVVPVLVPAAALVGRPLLEALAQASTAHLAAFGLLEDVPPAFFRDRPHPGASWLVLIDGLDEIIDPRSRRQVLRTLTGVANGAQHSLYRFVVATRPLPDHELAVLGPRVPQYELQPFTRTELRHVALSWFTALNLSDPDQVTDKFIDDLTRTRLADVARTPLMTAMLCQLHAARSGQPLPVSRGGVYRDFVALLHQHFTGRAGARAQTRLAIEHYGDQALARAEHTLDHLPDLIACLAAERYAGNTRPAVDILAAQPDAARPRSVPETEWSEFLDAILRRCGLLTVRAGELAFIHQTLLEYLAACHATRDERTRIHTLRSLFNESARYWPWTNRPDIKPGTWGRKSWNPPRAEASYVGFLLDSGRTNSNHAVPILNRLATRGGIDGCVFIARQSRLGTQIPPPVIRAAADTLAQLALKAILGIPKLPENALEVIQEHLDQTVETLQLDFYQGMEEFADASTLSLKLDQHRLSAAMALAQLDRERGANVLDALARDSTILGFQRSHAAAVLAQLDKKRGTDLLGMLADNTTMSGGRVLAAQELLILGDERGIDLLLAFIKDSSLDPYERYELTDALAWNASLLFAHAPVKATTALLLGGLGKERTADAFDAVARNPALEIASRLLAAVPLGGLDKDRAVNLLDSLTHDTTLTDQDRAKVADVLGVVRQSTPPTRQPS